MYGLTGRGVLQTAAPEDVAGLVRVAADSLLESWPDIESSPLLAEALRPTPPLRVHFVVRPCGTRRPVLIGSCSAAAGHS